MRGTTKNKSIDNTNTKQTKAILYIYNMKVCV